MASRQLLVDSNLAVLLIVGLLDKRHIASHKRLQVYDESDFDLLARFVGSYSSLILSPNVLTETSNLIRQVGEPRRTDLSNAMARFVAQFEERIVPSGIAVARAEHSRLGLTDAVLLELAADGATILTVDLDLYLAASSAGYDPVNFNHLREAAFGL